MNERPACRELSRLRPQCATGFLCALALCFFLAAGLGCRSQNRIARRPVAEIYQEAVEASANSRMANENARLQSSLNHHSLYGNHPPKAAEMDPPHSAAPDWDESRFADQGGAVDEKSLYRDYFFEEPGTVAQVGFEDDSVQTVQLEIDSSLGGNNGSEPLLNEVFEQTDIREALSILSSLCGAQVVIDDTVGGLVSGEITDATFDNALNQLLAPLGYEFAREGNRYFICPPDPEAPLFNKISERSSFQSRYQNVAEMVELLPGRYQPFIKISEPRNLVIIDAPPRIVRELQSRLSELDQPVPQVELEAIVCVVSPDSGFRFGLDWNQAVTVDGVESLSAGITGLAFNSTVSDRGLRNAFSNFSVTSTFVRALASEGYLSIRAAPRVTARNGEKAEISIARETFFSLQPSSANVLFRQDVQKVEAGIGLDITPRIRGDVISVQIDRAEVSENINATDSDVTGANSFPVINRRTVSTNVDVADGETIVIGGLVQRQQVEQINRISGLSRIPGIGKLFQTKQVEEIDVEVAIFISPRIVPPIPVNLTNDQTPNAQFSHPSSCQPVAVPTEYVPQ